MARLDGGPTSGPGGGPDPQQLPDVHADHVRELRARADRGAGAAGRGAGRHDRGGQRDPAAGTTADLAGRLRIRRLCAHGQPPRTRSLHARGRRSLHRSGLPVRRLAVQAFPLRRPVHALELCGRPARHRRRAVGLQGRRGGVEPRGGGAHRAGGGPPRLLAAMGRRVRRPEPGAARAGGRRRPQRHADTARAGTGAGADGRYEPALQGRRGHARCGRGNQGHGRAAASVPASRRPPA
jgi:hypothetical protein